MSFVRFQQRNRIASEINDQQATLSVAEPRRRRNTGPAQSERRIETRGTTLAGLTQYLQSHNVGIETLRFNTQANQPSAADYFFPGSTEVHYRQNASNPQFIEHVYRISFRSFDRYFDTMRPLLRRAMLLSYREMNAFRAGLHLDIEVIELNELTMDGNVVTTVPGTLTSNESGAGIPPVEGEYNIGAVLEAMIAKVRADLERMMYQHSQLIFHQVVRMRLSCASMGLRDARRLVHRRVLAGRGLPLETQQGWMEMNMPLMLRECLTDVFHTTRADDMCFLYALWYGMLRQISTVPLDETDHKFAVDDVNFFTLNLMHPVLNILNAIPTDIEYPLHPNDLYRVDLRLNRVGFSINAYHYQGNEEVIGTLYTSPAVHRENMKHVDLLLINGNIDSSHPINHWVLISDFALFISANHMFGKVYTTLRGKKSAMLRLCAKALECDWVCRICVKKCRSEEDYAVHTRLCTLDRVGGKGCTEIYKSPENAIFYFDDYSKLFMDPFVVYADFECLVQKTSSFHRTDSGNTIQDQRHIPISCAFRIGTFNDDLREWIPEEYQRIFMLMDRTVTRDSYTINSVQKKSKTTQVAAQFIEHMIELRQHLLSYLDNEEVWETPCTFEEYYALVPAKCVHCCFCRIPLGLLEFKHPMYKDNDAFDRGPCVAFQPFEQMDSPDRILGVAHRLCFWKFLGSPFHYAGKFGDNQNVARQKYNLRIEQNPSLFNLYTEMEPMEDLFRELVKRVGPRYYTQMFTLKIFFHNLTGYDGHLLIQAIQAHHTNISCIPQQGDKFLSLKFSGLHFLDSYKFLKGSLDDLARTTTMGKIVNDQLIFSNPEERAKCVRMMKSALDYIGEVFHVTMTDERINLLLRKGVFPYEYFSTPGVLDETSLPSRDKFDSLLYGSSISEKDYLHAQHVWEMFNMTKFGNYHDLYLLVDVMLLHMIFEQFRMQEYKLYGFDVTQFYSLPGYAFSQCLYLADARVENSIFTLDLIDSNQIEMAKMFESMKRGGISCIMTRYASVHMKENEEIKLFDANNLYGWAMSQPLPVGGYRYLSQFEIAAFMNNNTLATYDRLTNPKGYILEVDLHLPVEFHEKFRYYPMFPIKRTIRYEETSPYYRSQTPLQSHDDKTSKLVLDLHDRSYYSTYIANLQLGLEEGYQLRNVWRIMEFDQTPWMESHIRRQTEARQRATTEIGKNVPKLIANSTYGKTIEDSRRHRTVKIVTDADKFERIVKSAKYDTHRIVNDGIVVVHQKKTRIEMNRPIMVGIVILELSKLLMYTFYYRILYKVFGNRLRLLMTDTDSLGIHVCGLGEGGIMGELRDYHQEWFDLSNYPPEYDYSNANNLVVGKMKDEFIDKTSSRVKKCTEFIGCKAKMLSFEFEDFSPKMVAKGVSTAVLKKQINHEMYKQAIFGDQDENTNIPAMTMYSIRSDNNRLYTYKMEKSTLDAMDDKIYLLDREHCVPYGYVQVQ